MEIQYLSEFFGKESIKERKMESVLLSKIICESNRKYTKDEGDDQLRNSIKQYGIIQAPLLRRIDDDQFKVIAGRRRIEVARRLNLTHVICEVREADDDVDDEEIALTENVNRQEMHPLDEANAFKKMFDNHAPIEEIARYYARSPSAIYARLRLCGLTDNLKIMLRDGKINISGAILIAELPEDDQNDFYQLYECKENIDSFKIADFIKKKQRYVIKKCMKSCEGCDKRTHNEGNELFEEFNYLHDVCLDADCYRSKWYEVLELRLNEQIVQMQEAGLQTDNKIYFYNGVPELIYKKAAFVNITTMASGQEKYEILRAKDYEFIGETNRKKGACWEVRENVDSGLIVRRIGYKERPPKEKKEQENTEKEYSSSSLNGGADIKKYGNEVIKEIAKERGISSKELTKNLYDEKIYSHDFKSDISDLVSERIIKKRIKEEKDGIAPVRDYFFMFLQLVEENAYTKIPYIEKDFSKEQKDLYNKIIGDKSISKILLDFNDEAKKLFHFLLLSTGLSDEAPYLDALEDIEKSDNIFWKYAAMTKDEYRTLYMEAAKEVVNKVLESKEKKNKKPINKSTVPKEEDTDIGADPSSSSKQKNSKNSKQKDEVRKCRVCGRTNDKVYIPCEKDICSACADNTDDNYPFSPPEEDDNELEINLDEEDVI